MSKPKKYYDYYGHKSKGFVSDYFGEIGPLVKVSMFKYYYLKLRGYRVTKKQKGAK